MKRKTAMIVVMLVVLPILGSIGTSAAQSSQTCETCPMTVGDDALDHLKVTDGNGTRHYVECIGCALKLLKTYDTIRIETYCDWYGPDYKVTADISQHGATTTVNPQTALLLLGGGCTANRVAYNQTAADALLANGFSEHTMMMMQQALPANTNVTTITKRALTFAPAEAVDTSQSPLIPILFGVVALVVIIGSVVAYKKLKH